MVLIVHLPSKVFYMLLRLKKRGPNAVWRFFEYTRLQLSVRTAVFIVVFLNVSII